ncbi:MAG: hypothetical protein AAGJ50_14845, partial [Pseudomonadota bacterium]
MKNIFSRYCNFFKARSDLRFSKIAKKSECVVRQYITLSKRILHHFARFKSPILTWRTSTSAVLPSAALGLFLGSATAQTPSGFSFIESSGIGPEAAVVNLHNENSATIDSSLISDEYIAQLANDLEYDLVDIYEYVYNNVRYSPSFGLKKGALGAIFDSEGTAFDQAQLLVALLRHSDLNSGTDYNPNYRFGIVDLSQ